MRPIGIVDAMLQSPNLLKKCRRVEKNCDEANISDSWVDLAPILSKELFSRIAQKDDCRLV